MPTYYRHPSPTRGEFNRKSGGIVTALCTYSALLPEFGWTEIDNELEADLVVGHLSTRSERLDVFHLHGLYPTGELDCPGGWWDANSTIIENIRRAHQVIAVSDWVAELLRREMHLDPYVLPHGFDFETWEKVKPAPDLTHPFVLWNKTRNRGVCDPTPVIELAHRLPGVLFATTFLPVGITTTPPNVRVLGLMPREEAWSVVKAASVYLATTKETFGIGTLEAMASAVPVVAYNWGAVPGNIGPGGLLVNPGDYDTLASTVQEALDRGDEIGLLGHQYVHKHFSWRDVVRRLSNMYTRVLEGNESTSPHVTVVIPCHNYSSYVAHAIDCVSKQTFENWELIVVDDGSTDNSAEVIREAIRGEPRARLIRQEKMGVAHARNHGISKARGKFLCCLDADDGIAPTFLETTLPAIEHDSKLGIVYTGITLMNEDGDLRDRVHSWPHTYDRVRGMSGNQIPTCCVFRRDDWQRVGGYRQRFAPHGAGQEDADLWFRLLAYGRGAKLVTGEGLFHYRLHSRQTTRLHKGDWSRDEYPSWHPWAHDCRHLMASQLAIPTRGSFPIHDYDRPKVSIIVPIGPGHEGIYMDALDSVEAQTFREWELVVVNDTGCELDLSAYPFAHVVTTKGSQGAGFARNRGTEIAKAPLIVYLDADDFLQPSFLTKTIETWVDNQGHWVYTDTMILHPDGRLENYSVPDWDVRRLWRRGLAGVTSLHTKASWEQVNGFDEESTREDWDFHLRLAKAGICGIHIPEPLYTYRHSTGKRRGEGTHKREIITIHGTYDQEELVMACKGCGAKKIRRRKMDDIKTTSDNWSAKSDTGFVNLEYVGRNKNELMFKGPSRRRYRFGANEYHRTGMVHPDDVQHLLRLNCFRVATQPVPSSESAPLHADPSPKPSPVITPDVLTDIPEHDTLETTGLDLNIGAHSIQDLKDMDLTKYNLDIAIRLEKAGKNRKSALTLLSRAQRRLARSQKKVTPSEPGEPSEPSEPMTLSEPIEETHETPDETHEDIPEDTFIEDTPPEVTYAKSVYGDHTIAHTIR